MHGAGRVKLILQLRSNQLDSFQSGLSPAVTKPHNV